MPHGLARFCSGPAWAEAALSASLYMAATSRWGTSRVCVVDNKATVSTA